MTTITRRRETNERVRGAVCVVFSGALLFRAQVYLLVAAAPAAGDVRPADGLHQRLCGELSSRRLRQRRVRRAVHRDGVRSCRCLRHLSS